MSQTLIPVENPVHAAYKQVPSKITTVGDSVKIEMDINNKRVEKIYRNSDAAVWLEHAGYGAITEYTLGENKLFANLSINVSPAESAGTLALEYDSNLKVVGISYRD